MPASVALTFVLQDAALQHPEDQADDPLVSHAVPQTLDQPRPTDTVKIRSDVSLDTVGDPLLLEGPTEGIQAIMRVASRAVAITAVFEYGLVDGL